MFVAAFHCGPNVGINRAKREVDKLIVVQDSGFSRELTRRSITIIHETANQRGICPGSFVEPTIYLQLRHDPCDLICRNLLSESRFARQATQQQNRVGANKKKFPAKAQRRKGNAATHASSSLCLCAFA